ncbi:hypothetical protein SADUNF_Sadunf18G0104800 [Salix dunnii]|uniref:Homeobox domain-containing protein n=1 Tax=Salix dunnii TaxID=1413687 RepID=A0A835J3P3_9ROSI|nr:hypothetical protein SADUNF_Sadunf18G0104800 [Salix dunnii]
MEEGYCDTRLGLALGGANYEPWPQERKEKPAVRLDLSFTLCPKHDAMDIDHRDKAEGIYFKSEEDEECGNKRSDEYSVDSSIDGSGRKKLRLTKEQSSLLEESFKRHTTLNPAQKHTLAERLNLKPRQVEVWFQNRRARTKLKQTEVDCEFLKKCCESLSNENRRLKKELQDLRSQKHGRSQPAKDAIITACSSCMERITTSQRNVAVVHKS